MDIVDDQQRQRKRTNGGDACDRQLCGRNDAGAESLVAINPYHLDPLSVYARISFGFNSLESSRFSCPFSLFVPFILIIIVIDVSCVLFLRSVMTHLSHSLLLLSSFLLLLYFFSPFSLLLLSSFSPLSLLYPPLSLLYLIINISFNLDADEVELLIRSK